MPELPEVETMVRELHQQLQGQRFQSLILQHTDLLTGVSPTQLLRELPGQQISRVQRRAKHALILTSSKVLAVQPGMTGTFLVVPGIPTEAQLRYAVLVATLSGGLSLIYRDVRRFGTIRWLTPPEWDAYSNSLGPEPLDPGFTPAAFAARVHRSRAAIKKVIMDQRVVVGVGNIYANEALFAAEIDPSRPGSALSEVEATNLFQQIRRILELAIAGQGTSFRDYRTSTGDRGGFQDELLVYGREGLPCRHCGTTLVGTHQIDARATVFCWRCQR